MSEEDKAAAARAAAERRRARILGASKGRLSYVAGQSKELEKVPVPDLPKTIPQKPTSLSSTEADSAGGINTSSLGTTLTKTSGDRTNGKSSPAPSHSLGAKSSPQPRPGLGSRPTKDVKSRGKSRNPPTQRVDTRNDPTPTRAELSLRRTQIMERLCSWLGVLLGLLHSAVMKTGLQTAALKNVMSGMHETGTGLPPDRAFPWLIDGGLLPPFSTVALGGFAAAVLGVEAWYYIRLSRFPTRQTGAKQPSFIGPMVRLLAGIRTAHRVVRAAAFAIFFAAVTSSIATSVDLFLPLCNWPGSNCAPYHLPKLVYQ